MNEPYVHLHNHTAFSLLDGAMSSDQLGDRIVSLGMESLAITDHGTLSGLPAFQEAARARGIKPILGCEAYIVDSVVRVKEEKQRKRFHQVILAKNQQGLENLYKLMSWANKDGRYYRPLIDLDKLEECREGLIVTSSCMQGYANQTLLGTEGTPGFGETLSVRRDESMKIHRHYKDIFGEDYYLEVHRHGIEEENIIAEFLLEVSKKLDIPVISANDCHYVNDGDEDFQDALVCMGTGQYISSTDRMKISHESLYVKSGLEMINLFPDFPDSGNQTLLLAEKCDAEIVFHGDNGDYLFPHFPIPKGQNSPKDYLWSLCMDAFGDRYPKAIQDEEYHTLVMARISHEFNVITKMGFEEYFLIVQDITREARKRGIPVGPGRGSAAGSAISFLLGITNLEPIKHGLLFERFLNEGRMSMPDIDLDVSDEGRQEVIEYMRKKYGEDKVCQIVAFSTLGAASGIQNFSRVLQIPFSVSNATTKKIPNDPKIRSKSLDVLLNEIPELQELRDTKNSDEIKMVNYAIKAHGYPRHMSVHAAGVVITPEITEKYVPTMMHAKTKTVTTQYDGSMLDSLGLVKMDILGLKTLSVIQNTVDLIKDQGKKIDEEAMYALDDPLVYSRVFAKGETSGVFQLESDGMKKWLRELVPDNFNDIVAMTSLYRPGPMDLIPSYIDRKHRRERVEYLHSSLIPVLQDTYGIPVYQEQVMEMARVIAGYSLADADILRRAMGKKKKSEMDKQRKVFQRGAKKQHEISAEDADKIFDTMEKFSGYGFNKSHAAAYSVLSYAQAYLLTHYPVEYFTATLERSDFESLSSISQDAKRMGINLLPPDVNKSQSSFSIENGVSIRYGIDSLKGVGKESKKVFQKRPYLNFIDFMNKCVPRQNVAEALIKAGAFDETDGIGARSSLLEITKDYLKYVREVQKKKFGKRKSDPKLPDCMTNASIGRIWTPKQALFQEMESTGCFLSGHPLGEYAPLSKLLDSMDDTQYGRRKVRAFTGTITNVTHVLTKSKTNMWFLELSTSDNVLKFAIFEKKKERFDLLLQEEKNVVVFASEYMGEFSTLESIIPVEQALIDLVSGIHVAVNDKNSAKIIAEQFSDLLEDGDCDLWINLEGKSYSLIPDKKEISPMFLRTLMDQDIDYTFL